MDVPLAWESLAFRGRHRVAERENVNGLIIYIFKHQYLIIC